MRTLCFILLLCPVLTANTQIDSLNALLRTGLADTVRMATLRELGYQITMSYDELDEGQRSYRGCIDLAKRTGNLYWQAHCTYGLAINRDVAGELTQALQLLDSAEALFSTLGDLEYQGNVLNARGTAYFYQGVTDKAMAHFMDALAFAEKNDLLLCRSQALNNIAIVHRRAGEHQEALGIYRRSIQVKRRLGDERGIANTLSNMGVAYGHLGLPDSALQRFSEAIVTYRALGDAYEVGSTQLAMAEVYLDHDDFAQAGAQLEEALVNLKDSPEDQFSTAQAHLLLGRALTGQGKTSEALAHLRITEGLIASSDRAEMIAELHAAKAEVLHASGAHREAFTELKRAHALQDSIQGEDAKRSLEELRTRFDTQEKEKQIEMQQLQLAQQEQRRRTFLAIVAALALLMLAAVGMVIARIRSNRRLDRQKQLVETALAEKELLLREIHHRVKNNLQTVSSLLSIQGRGITDEKAKEAVNDSRLRVKSMALIHQDLYREGDLTGVRMKEYVEKLVTSLVTSYAMGARVRADVQVDDIALDVDSAVPIGLILNELVTNALKYAWPEERNGALNVSLCKNGNVLALVVADDGAGKAGTVDDERSSGFGLSMVKTFADKLKAEWTMHQDKGTAVRLLIRNFKLAR
jgi:two-component sensor histidine kinase/Tfp pilus assembly protein PilF